MARENIIELKLASMPQPLESMIFFGYWVCCFLFCQHTEVFSGHQPHGESPTVVRHVRSGLLVITADTSWLGMDGIGKLSCCV